jgi:hypothetical protein
MPFSTPRRTLISATVIVVFGLFLALAGAYGLSVFAVGESQHNWCSALTILTRNPVNKPADPAGNPSRENYYKFYLSLLTLERHFDC